jgi:hypothetical protein
MSQALFFNCAIIPPPFISNLTITAFNISSPLVYSSSWERIYLNAQIFFHLKHVGCGIYALPDLRIAGDGCPDPTGLSSHRCAITRSTKSQSILSNNKKEFVNYIK